jgi:DNA repair photolyase
VPPATPTTASSGSRWSPTRQNLSSKHPHPQTVYLLDVSRSIIARNDSPDTGFDASINPYRGCSHGCAYCYARPTHEYLGLSAGLDFESKILVKRDAPKLLRKQLGSPCWEPKILSMSGVTDPYQPFERKLRITRGCLEMLAEFRNPVIIVTKNTSSRGTWISSPSWPATKPRRLPSL